MYTYITLLLWEYQDPVPKKMMKGLFRTQFVLLFIVSLASCRRPDGHICPEEVNIGWLQSPPYVFKSSADGNVTGALVAILQNAFEHCCLTNFTFRFVEQYSTISKQVQASVHSNVDVVLPVRTNIGKDYFLTSPYVHIVESPGSVFYNLNHSSTRRAVVNILFSCIPAVALLLVWVCVFGALFWIVDVIPKKEGVDRTLREMAGELCESIWWAFVTLATVGYGDVVPSRCTGRILCYVWLFFSSVSVAYFSATVTSLLIAECFNAELAVENTNIAVLNSSREHSLVVQRHGIAYGAETMSELLKSIEENSNVDGVIIELYTASFYDKQLHKYRIQKVFEDVHSYGVVLRTRTIVLQRCLVQYVLTTQREIYNGIREKFPPLKSNISLSASEETSQNLLVPKVESLQHGFIGICAVLVTMCVIGILMEKYKLKRRALSKNDPFENFVLLQNIKSNYRLNLCSMMCELKADIDQLQNTLDVTLTNIEGVKSEELFRAKHNNNKHYHQDDVTIT